MKNKLFKVCTLGFVLATLLTGCNSKKGEVSKIKKNEEIKYSRESKLDDIYGIELNRYTNNYQLEGMYNDAKDILLHRDEVVNVDVITKEDDVYEAVITLDADWLDEKEYEYILLIKDKTDYVSLYQTSKNIKKDNVKEIGQELKEKFTKSNDYKKTFDEYTKENDLTIDQGYGCNGLAATCKDSTVASPIKTKDYTETDKKVTEVGVYDYRLSPNTFKSVLEAKTENDEIVWSQKRGTIPYGIGFIGYVETQGEKYFYEGNYEKISALDIQTGKLVWNATVTGGTFLYKFIETNDKLFIFDNENIVSLEVKDLKDGKTIHFDENISKNVLRNTGNEEDYYSISFEDMKLDNDKIICKVYDESTDELKQVGKLIINTNDYTINFNKE